MLNSSSSIVSDGAPVLFSINLLSSMLRVLNRCFSAGNSLIASVLFLEVGV